MRIFDLYRKIGSVKLAIKESLRCLYEARVIDAERILERVAEEIEAIDEYVMGKLPTNMSISQRPTRTSKQRVPYEDTYILRFAFKKECESAEDANIVMQEIMRLLKLVGIKRWRGGLHRKTRPAYSLPKDKLNQALESAKQLCSILDEENHHLSQEARDLLWELEIDRWD